MNFLGKKTDFHKDLRTRSPSRCANIVITQKHPNLSYSAENKTPSGEEWRCGMRQPWRKDNPELGLEGQSWLLQIRKGAEWVGLTLGHLSLTCHSQEGILVLSLLSTSASRLILPEDLKQLEGRDRLSVFLACPKLVS